jgi:hypothetical protein
VKSQKLIGSTLAGYITVGRCVSSRNSRVGGSPNERRKISNSNEFPVSKQAGRYKRWYNRKEFPPMYESSNSLQKFIVYVAQFQF